MELEISPYALAHLPVVVELKRSKLLGSARDDRGWWWDVWLAGKNRVRAYSGRTPGLSAGYVRKPGAASMSARFGSSLRLPIQAPASSRHHS
jgi:hypothetical protein